MCESSGRVLVSHMYGSIMLSLLFTRQIVDGQTTLSSASSSGGGQTEP